MLYTLFGISVLCTSLIIASKAFDDEAGGVKDILDSIGSILGQYKEAFGWISFALGFVFLIFKSKGLLGDITGILVGAFVLKQELLKIPALGELFENLSEGLQSYSKVLAIFGIAVSLFSIFGIFG